MKKVKQGYKQTSIGLLPEDWKLSKLKDLILNKGDYGINAAAVNFDENLPAYIRITDIDDDGYFIKSKRKSVDQINSSSFYLEKNNLVFVRTGASVGKAYLYDEKDGQLVFAGFLIRFKIDDSKSDPYYLWSFTKTANYWNWVKSVSTRSGQPGINSIEYSMLQIPIPPLPEQQKIAAILSTWDEAITKQKQLVEQTKKRNQGLAQQLLSGKKRLKGFDGKWKSQKIKDFAVEQSIKNKENQDFVVLSCTKHNGLVPSLEYFGRQIFSENLETYKIVEKGSFAYATNHIEEGSIGYQRTFENALISPMYTVFKTDDTIIDEFLFRLLKSHSYIHEYQKRMEGSIDRRGGLRWSEFAKIKVEVPGLNEQNAINEFLEMGNKELRLLEQQLNSLQNEKKGLMQKLLTGEVRVKTN